MASLLHDDVLDDADTRRGIGSLNFVMGNKVVSMNINFELMLMPVHLDEHNKVNSYTLILCTRGVLMFIELDSFLLLHHKYALYFITVVCRILLFAEDSSILCNHVCYYRYQF